MKKKTNKKKAPVEVTTEGSIKIGKESKETVYRYEMEYDDNIEKPLIDWAMKRIVNDKEALINYAVNGILREQMIEIEKRRNEKHEQD